MKRLVRFPIFGIVHYQFLDVDVVQSTVNNLVRLYLHLYFFLFAIEFPELLISIPAKLSSTWFIDQIRM